MAIYQVLMNCKTDAPRAGVSVFHFDTLGGTAQQAADSCRALYVAMASGLSNHVSFYLDGNVKTLDPVTGSLLAVTGVSTGTTVVGANNAQPVADATQMLVRWGTTTIVGNRIAKGRTFVPGIPQISLSNGNISAASQSTMATNIATWLGAATSMPVVWHRPKNGGGGSASLITSVGVWSELAIQRRRRN